MYHDKKELKPLTTYERLERIVFLLAVIVVLLDVFVWRP